MTQYFGTILAISNTFEKSGTFFQKYLRYSRRKKSDNISTVGIAFCVLWKQTINGIYQIQAGVASRPASRTNARRNAGLQLYSMWETRVESVA